MTNKITGYRELSQDEIGLINEIKLQEQNLAAALKAIRELDSVKANPNAQRWVAVASTHLETGLMYLVKAVAQPTTGLGVK